MITAAPIAETSRFEARSAIAPPNGPSTAIEMPWPSRTNPTAPFRPVSSNATIACTIVDMKKAVKVLSDPAHRIA